MSGPSHEYQPAVVRVAEAVTTPGRYGDDDSDDEGVGSFSRDRWWVLQGEDPPDRLDSFTCVDALLVEAPVLEMAMATLIGIGDLLGVEQAHSRVWQMTKALRANA